jgi:hypothetical protein
MPNGAAATGAGGVTYVPPAPHLVSTAAAAGSAAAAPSTAPAAAPAPAAAAAAASAAALDSHTEDEGEEETEEEELKRLDDHKLGEWTSTAICGGFYCVCVWVECGVL